MADKQKVVRAEVLFTYLKDCNKENTPTASQRLGCCVRYRDLPKNFGSGGRGGRLRSRKGRLSHLPRSQRSFRSAGNHLIPAILDSSLTCYPQKREIFSNN